MPDGKENNPQTPLDFFRVKSAEANSSTTVANLRRAVDSFSSFTKDAEIRFEDFNESLLGEWVATQLFQGYSVSTVSYNVKKLASLYNKAVEADLAPPTDAFTLLQAKLNDPSSSRFDNAADKETFNKLRKIISTDFSAVPTRQLAKDILLFSIYCGGLSFEQIASFKKDSYTGDNEYILQIIERYSKPKNKYLFPLNQIRSTKKQLNQTLTSIFEGILRYAGLCLSPNPSDTPLMLWCQIAMSSGFTPSEIAACAAPRCNVTPITAFVVPAKIDSEDIDLIRTDTIETLADNPVRWYAMHFRPHVDYQMITDRLRERGIPLPDIYYPMEEITRRVGNKKIFETRPVISWLLFFRERVTELNRLYHNIGDLAWGYRQSRTVGSPYASISIKDLTQYQMAIGTLTPDVQFLSDDDVQINKGDYLVLLGGAFNGRPAIFDSIVKPQKDADPNKIIYRLIMSGGNNINWTVNWDSHLVKKISEQQFLSLLNS
ncbi:MAG: hypothetical protein HDR88_04100 [Bacteroides sp.]|nr:hypothetical protein [Bacteroides sp.]